MRLPADGCLDRGFDGNWIEPHEHAAAAVGRFVRLGWWAGPATLLGGAGLFLALWKEKATWRWLFLFREGNSHHGWQPACIADFDRW